MSQKITSIGQFSPRALIDLKTYLEPWFRSRASTAGAASTANLLANWAGVLPSIAGPGVVFRVPELTGASHTWTISKCTARIETVQVGSVVFLVEKSAGGGAFSATTVATLTIAAAAREVSVTGLSVSVTTGDLLRIKFSVIGSTGSLYSVEAEGS